MATLEDNNVFHTALGKLKGRRHADDAATDDDDPRSPREIARIFSERNAILVEGGGHPDSARSRIQPPVPS